MFKMLLLSLVVGSTLVGCAGSPLGAAMSKHPSEADVEGMVVDKTTKADVEAKFSGHKTTIANGLKCNIYFKPSYIGEGSKTTYLCFDEKGLLKQKYFM